MEREHDGQEQVAEPAHADDLSRQVTSLADRASATHGVSLGGAIAQAKLSVGPSGDRFEREADSVAGRVVRALRSGTAPIERPDAEEGRGAQRIRRAPRIPQPATPVPARVSRIQRSARVGAEGGELDADTDRLLRSSRSGGQELPAAARSPMEQAFGADFGAVRVHSGSTSRELNDRIQAKAFTTGNDIYFRDGLPDVSRPADQELLAHELTHTIQQGPATINRSPDVTVGATSIGPDTIQRDDEYADAIEMTTFRSNVPEPEDEELDAIDPTITRAVKVVREAEDGDRKLAVEAYIQAKKQSKASRGGAEGEATALAVAKASASAEVKRTLTSLEALVEAGVLNEASLELTGTFKQTVGPVTAQIMGKVRAHATASLKASASAKIDTSGITLEAGAEAVAEVGVDVSAAFSLATKEGSQLAKLSAKGQATAGARAKASGTAKVTDEGIVLSGEFEAFAGVEAKGQISFVIGPDEAPYLSAVLKGGVSAGVGAKGSGTFKIEGGQIILSAELAASLGLGASHGFDVAIGYKAIATAIYEGVAASFAPVEPEPGIEMTTFKVHSAGSVD